MAAKVLLLGCTLAFVLATACSGSDEPADGVRPQQGAVSQAAPTATPTPRPDDRPYPDGALGYAISWPQCGGPFPPEPFDFGIVGVTFGWAGSRNPCFADEYRWALRGRYHPSVYMNMNYAEHNDLAADPARCGPPCRAYRYGRSVAVDAYDYAASTGAVAPVWWIDVQIVSDWSADPELNADSIRGAADFLQSKGLRVGISSTAYQWGAVAGNAQHSITVWDASALDAEQAAVFCRDGKDFGGGRTEQIAYVANHFETVLACGLPPVQ